MKTNRLLCLAACLLLGVAGVRAQTAAARGDTRTQFKYLSGTGKDDGVPWDFYCTAGRRSGAWSKIPVPSNWELQGFGAYNFGRPYDEKKNPGAREQGKYRLSFNVPAGWKGKVVRIVFDGVMTDAEVLVNGQSAGPVHQGSFYRFKYDITPLLKYGAPNLLEVNVSKVSANESVNRAERFGSDYWVFGGIFRPVYLEALPAAFIDWTAVDARADGRFSVDVHLGEGTSYGAVFAQILDVRGRPVGARFGADVGPGVKVIRLETRVAAPRLWTAETPNLYRVQLTLRQGGKGTHTVAERFGFRTFEVRPGDGLYLNGQRILLKGTNRHSFWPESGRTTSRELSYSDVRLLKEMNNNAVRMSHYPPDAHFLEACDELGLYVLDELGGWQRSYDTETGRKLIGEMVRRDVNHPSILFWDNGNEGGWNRENDGEFAKYDPQGRQVLHPWELHGGVDTNHYEAYESHAHLTAGPNVYMPTEFLHALYDGGGGAGLWDYWEVMRKSRFGGGGFIWALLDECVARTDMGGKLDCSGNQAPDGVLGPHREREGSFYAVREIWSPVQVVGPQELPNDSRVSFALENRFDFTDLAECGFEWQLARFPSPFEKRSGHVNVAAGSLKGPRVAPHGAGELKIDLPPVWKTADVLYLTAKDPAGRELWTWSRELKRAPASARTSARAVEGEVSTRDVGGSLFVQTGALQLRFDKRTGLLAEVRDGGRLIPFGDGPRFLAFRRDGRKYVDTSGPSDLTFFEPHTEGGDLIVEAHYNGALRQTRWRVSPGGAVRLEYSYTFDGDVDLLGVQFDAPEHEMRAVRWLGRGPYRVWQNRTRGTRLDVWERGHNDTTPGESWVYPEFKGYFDGWRWAAFETTAGSITLINESPDSYLGVFKPKDGRDGILDLPETGIALLDVIPAVGSKFQPPDQLGPQSRQRHVSGTTRGAVLFHFDANTERQR
ncbi:MAG: glycoside hydrolase family 2 [Acidobacteria bacterium]|nr:glycoside hydrolase family 2 [Acidobacteriota bacterium]